MMKFKNVFSGHIAKLKNLKNDERGGFSYFVAVLIVLVGVIGLAAFADDIVTSINTKATAQATAITAL